MRTFYRGKEAAQQFLALYTYINYLRRHNIPREKALFYYIEELILQSFNARIIALFLLYIRNKYNIKVDSEAKRYIRNLSPQQFLEHVKDIRIVAFLRDIYRNANQRTSDYLEPPANTYQPAATSSSTDILSFTANNYNTEFFNYIRFLQVINTYKLLKYAIKYADIRLLKRIISYLYLYFTRRSLNNYIYNILILQQLVRISACNLVL